MILKIDFKRLAVNILVPLILGAIVGFLSGSFNGYKEINMPSFAPPGILFPIVWSILYILMGVSKYILQDSGISHKALSLYNLQLIVNLLWSFIFFTFKWYLVAFLWIILLILLVILMIKEFLKISKSAAYLQIPYLLWIIFAAVLNFAVYLLN